ncbi:hypothetical protein BH10CYA1_BH10CYA1_55220 [soil metagenome]
MDLTRYIFRCGGKSQRFFSLLDRAHLRQPEALLAALLSKGSRSAELLRAIDASSLSLFLDLVSANELTGFVLESIYVMRLESELRSLSINHHGTDVDLLTLMTRQAGLEAIKFEKFQKKFAGFLELTAALNRQLIWLKGIVTSRTCYASPEYRLSGDFDCYVNPKHFSELFEILKSNDFNVITRDTGFCNQLGVGPVGIIDDLFLVPSIDFVPSAVCGMYKNRWPLLDLKVNPLDRGLRMVELERFERDAVLVYWRDTTFSAPDLLDQLMIALTHFEKDRFVGWKQLLDIKLLAEKVNSTPELWNEFVRRCRIEGVSTACTAGLSLARDRLELTDVDGVIEELAPKDQSYWRRTFTFTVTPLFYWNTSSMLMLLANAKLSDDSARKMRVLKESFCPNKKFLSNYYFDGHELNPLTSTLALWLHWMTLCLPGGIVRRTFGKLIWKQNQFGINE